MLEKLKEVTGYETCMTFGSIPENYDVVVHASAGDDVVKFLKKAYEPLIWRKKDR